MGLVLSFYRVCGGSSGSSFLVKTSNGVGLCACAVRVLPCVCRFVSLIHPKNGVLALKTGMVVFETWLFQRRGPVSSRMN